MPQSQQNHGARPAPNLADTTELRLGSGISVGGGLMPQTGTDPETTRPRRDREHDHARRRRDSRSRHRHARSSGRRRTTGRSRSRRRGSRSRARLMLSGRAPRDTLPDGIFEDTSAHAINVSMQRTMVAPEPGPLPAAIASAGPPAGFFLAGLPPRLGTQTMQDILHSLSRHAPSFAPGISVRFLPGPRRNKAAFLAHAAFAACTAASNIWAELTAARGREASQHTIQTPTGPVRLELARGARRRAALKPASRSAGRARGRGSARGPGSRGRGVRRAGRRAAPAEAVEVVDDVEAVAGAPETSACSGGGCSLPDKSTGDQCFCRQSRSGSRCSLPVCRSSVA